MEDFESFYNKLCLKFQQRVDIVDNEYKDIKRAALKKAGMPFLVLTLAIGAYLYYSKNYDLWYLIITALILCFFYFIFLVDKAKKNSTTINDELPMEIYRSILSEFPYDLSYSKENGMDKEIYDKFFKEFYSRFDSNSTISGNFGNNNYFKMCHVETSSSDEDGRTYHFRGYVVEVDLNKVKCMPVTINKKKYKYIDDNVEDSKNNYLIEKIQEYLSTNDKKVEDCAISDNKLYIRIRSGYFEYLDNVNLLQRRGVEYIYNGLINVFDVSKEFLKIVDE